MVSSPQHEPTMEEILASIRKIISEDSTDAAPAVETKAGVPSEPDPVPSDDILDLTQEVGEEPMAAVEPEPVYEAPVPENDLVFEPIEEAVEPEPVVQADGAEGIFSDKTRQSIDDAFAAIEDEDIAEVPAPMATAAPMRSSATGASVEAVFERAVLGAFEPVAKQWLNENAPQLVEKMKPLIREWMDEHFPALLEGAVREEVARVARARGTKR